MRLRTGLSVAVGIAAMLFLAPGAVAQRQMERLGRGVVAVNPGGGNAFVSWRLLGTDPEDIGFNVYCATGGGKPVKLNQAPLKDSTSFVDRDARLDRSSAYFVRPVLNGQEQEASAPFTLPANAPARQYLSIPLRTLPGYTPTDASVADLDGDGEYEAVLHQAAQGRDNAQRGVTGQPVLEASRLDGTLLWRIDLGRSIREGAHYTQFMVYDLDVDGRAEVACKTADGTRDGAGKVIGDANADYRNASGYVLDGAEFLTVFDGKTGAAAGQSG